MHQQNVHLGDKIYFCPSVSDDPLAYFISGSHVLISVQFSITTNKSCAAGSILFSCKM